MSGFHRPQISFKTYLNVPNNQLPCHFKPSNFGLCSPNNFEFNYSVFNLPRRAAESVSACCEYCNKTSNTIFFRLRLFPSHVRFWVVWRKLLRTRRALSATWKACGPNCRSATPRFEIEGTFLSNENLRESFRCRQSISPSYFIVKTCLRAARNISKNKVSG